ncbi:MAG: GNAT family N-acetyltransferase [Gammaproteobacteria bacterium]|nr:GNAT family N-acetyltransferase [Gammaproteobacteria bacterium]
MGYKTHKVDWNNKQKEIMQIREKVFICEYRIPPDIEFDHKDKRCKHVLITDEKQVIATGRISTKGKISRIAVLQNYRNTEAPSQVINTLLNIAKERGLTSVALDTELHQVSTFQQQGFQTVSPVFMDSGIPKQTMACDISCFRCPLQIVH